MLIIPGFLTPFSVLLSVLEWQFEDWKKAKKLNNKFSLKLNPTKGLRRIRISPIEKKQIVVMMNELKQVILRKAHS